MYFDVESHWNHTSVKSFEDEMLAEMIECAGNKDKALYDTVKPTNRADLIYFTEWSNRNVKQNKIKFRANFLNVK